MTIPAILGALAVFFVIFFIGKLLGPKGEIGKKKEIHKRIFEGPEGNFKSESGSLLKHAHLSDIQSLQKFLEKQSFVPHLTLLLKRSGSKLSLSAFLLFYLSIACFVFVVAQFMLPFFIALLLAAACAYLPFAYLRKKNQSYLGKFSEHLPDATSIVSNALKVGQSIENAIEGVGRNAPHPVSTEFQIVAGELKLGMPLDAALRNMYARIQTPELKIFITGIAIQQELGGNLSEILENLEKTIRERFALQREIKVLSAQGVLSMWVLFVLPFVFALVWFFADRQLLLDFSSSPFGMGLIGFSFGIQMIAFFIMKKVVNIED